MVIQSSEALLFLYTILVEVISHLSLDVYLRTFLVS